MLDHLADLGIWEKINNIENEALRKKAILLPSLLDAAFAETSLQKYRSAWSKWVDWCKQYDEVQHCPADPFFICIYFNDLILDKAPIGAITAALCGIRWGHIKAGFSSPTDTPLVKLAFKGAKRLAQSTPGSNRKEPFTIVILQELVERYGDSTNLMDLRFLLIAILGFAGFFRISELLGLKIKNLAYKQIRAKFLLKNLKPIN